MSPERFPLVAFTDSNEDVPGLSSDKNADKKTCRNGAADRRCLTGNRQLEEANRPWRNLLDGVPQPVPPPEAVVDSGAFGLGHDPASEADRLRQLADNTTIIPPWKWTSDRRPLSTLLSLEEQPHGMSILVSVLFTAFLSVVWAYRKVKAGGVRGAGNAVRSIEVAERETKSQDDKGLAQLALEKTLPDVMHPVPKAPPPPLSLPVTPSIPDDYVYSDSDNGNVKSSSNDMVPGSSQPANDVVDGDDSEREGEGATPSKRKSTKKKRRGKKKKPSAANGGPEEEEGEKKEKGGNNVPAVEEPRVAGDISLLSLVIPSTPKAEPTPSSLVVSDTILGQSPLFNHSHCVVTSEACFQALDPMELLYLADRCKAVPLLLSDFCKTS
jgi:serine/threonine-protein kinase/endoribonuclease IRE1